jgi:hypothetical protein
MIKAKNISVGNLWNLPILKVELQEEDLKKLLHESDISLENNIDWSAELAGEINQGKQVKFNFVDSFNIEPLANEYIKKEFDLEGTLSVREAWVVSQYEGDYNPVHAHESLISGIIYLQVPPQIKEGFNKLKSNGSPCLDGCIHFIFDTYHRPSLRPLGPRAVLPEPGVMYLFPSYILHTVYPFKGPGERRCIAFNMDLKNE